MVQAALHEKSYIAAKQGVLLARDSGRRHKAWGRKPQVQIKCSEGARGSGRQPETLILPPVSRAAKAFCSLILGLAPQALCLRLLRRLRIPLLRSYVGLFVQSRFNLSSESHFISHRLRA